MAEMQYMKYGDPRITMPLAPTSAMLRAVRNNPLTQCDEKDEMNTRIGWLICAWDVLVEAWLEETRYQPPTSPTSEESGNG